MSLIGRNSIAGYQQVRQCGALQDNRADAALVERIEHVTKDLRVRIALLRRWRTVSAES